MSTENISLQVTIDKIRKSRLLNAIADFTKLPEIVSNVDKVVLTSESDMKRKSEWDVTFDGAPMSWVQIELVDNEKLTISFDSIAGDFDRFEGLWKIRNDQSGNTILGFDLSYEIGIPIIEELFGPVFKEKLSTNFLSILNKLKNNAVSLKVDERKDPRVHVHSDNTIIFNGYSVPVFVYDFSSKGIQFLSDRRMIAVDSIVIGETLLEIESYFPSNDIDRARAIFVNHLDKTEFNKLVRLLKPAVGIVDATIVEKTIKVPQLL